MSAKQDAYELSREEIRQDRRRQESEEEYRRLDEQYAEDARRLSRYDEAVELLRKLTSYQPLSDSDDGYIVAHEAALAFLAEEPKR